MPTPFRKLKEKSPGIGPLALFILPLPLFLVVIQSLASGQLLRLLTALGALAGFWLAGMCLRRAHVLEWESNRRRWSRSTRTPWRLMAGLLTFAGVGGISLVLLGHNIFVAVIAGLLGLAGVFLRYGFDPQHDKNKDVTLVGVTSDELIEIFDEAEGHVKEIENAARNISNMELKSRLLRIAFKTREILGIIEKDPKDLRRARKFLKVYLKGAMAVSTQYASTPHAADCHVLEKNLRSVLSTIEDVIEEQKAKLLQNDLLDLDVKIEVLEKQLRHEGVV